MFPFLKKRKKDGTRKSISIERTNTRPVDKATSPSCELIDTEKIFTHAE